MVVWQMPVVKLLVYTGILTDKEEKVELWKQLEAKMCKGQNPSEWKNPEAK